MAHKQDSGDEIGSISRQLESISTDSSQGGNQQPLRTSQLSTNVSAANQASRQQQGSESRSAKREFSMFGNSLPPVNCPEKIVFIIDTTREPDCTKYELGAGKKYTPLQMVKKTLEVFILAKSTLNRQHEFAIMTLDVDSVKMVCDFTNNFKQLNNQLEKINEVPIETNTCFDLSQCFDLIYSHIHFDSVTSVPTSVTRIILIYTRSHCIPIFTDIKYFEKLMRHPFFIVDGIYVHEPLSDKNSCEKIYGELQRLDAKDNSYIVEVGRNAAQLFNTVVKLVAHPLQRPKQDDANYNTFLTDTSSDV